MKDKKKIILFGIIAIVVLILIILIVLLTSSKSGSETSSKNNVKNNIKNGAVEDKVAEEQGNNDDGENEIILNEKISKIDSRKEYFELKECLTDYYLNVSLYKYTSTPYEISLGQPKERHR